MIRKILITGPSIADEALAILANRDAEAVIVPPYAESGEIAALAGRTKIDGLVVRMGRISKQVIAASARLRVIAKHGVGIDNIDIEAASRFGIPVMITRGANTRSVAEHAFAMMFSLLKQLPRLDRGLRDGKWEKPGFKGTELSHKCLGIVGFGSIGRDLALLAGPLRMRVVVFDPLLPARSLPAEVCRADTLDELLRQADVVSLHCPLTEAARNLIGAAQLACMKPTAFLVNTARGELVDEDALVAALEGNRIAGAGLDSFATEPPQAGHPLWKLPNVLLSPHVAGATEESLRRMGTTAVGHVLDVLDGRSIDTASVVNPEVLSVELKPAES